MNIGQLEVFCRVVKLGSFSAAARSMHLTQPAISLQIKSLEEWAGAPLLDRRGGMVRLTREGSIFLEFAESTLKISEQTRDSIQSMTGKLAGKLLVGASFSVGEYFLPRALAGFHLRHRKIAVEMKVANTTEVVRRVADGNLDLAVVEGEVQDGRLQDIPLVDDELLLIVSPDHEWARMGKIEAELLPHANWVLRESGSGTRALTEQTLQARGLPAIHPVMELGSSEAVKTAVEAGVGVSFISRLAIAKEVRIGTLCTVEVEGLRIMRRFRAVRVRNYKSPRVEALLRFLREGVEEYMGV